MRRQKHRWAIWAILGMLLLAGCGIEAAPNVPAAPARPQGRATARPDALPTTAGSPATTSRSTATGFFLVDKLVRSSQLSGIDLHVRYVERTADALIVHLSFYNNRGEDLAFVSGATVDSARLVGADTYQVSDRSAALRSGIAPDNGWLSGGATVGTLTFKGAQGDQFTLQFPGFPDVAFNLDQPIAAAPEPAPPANGAYTYDFEASSQRLQNIALRIEQARVEQDALLLTIAFVNRNNGDITFTSTVQGKDAVVFDGLWQQYSPSQVDQTLERGIQPAGSVWGEGEANRGTLTFARPVAGDVLLLRFPSYPLIRIPLKAGAPAALATDADLPPSVSARPTPTPDPTPTPLTGEEQARKAADDLLVALTQAIAAGNRSAYLAAFTPELQQAQGAIFDRIAKLPIEQIKLEPADADPNGNVNTSATEISSYQADISYRVRDVDPQNIFSSTLEYTLRQQDGRWLIAKINGQLPFWAYGPTEATRSGPFWIFYRPELAGDLSAIGQEAQQAYDLVNRTLPNRAQSVNVMHVTASEQEFADLTERSGEQFLGVAVARYRIRKAGIQITSQAFFINGAAFTNDPQQDRQKTIAHELTHLVLSPKTMPYTPAWISEGAAMYVTSDFPKDALTNWYRDGGAARLSLADLSAQTAFGERDISDQQTSINYAYSAFLAKYIVETYGQDKFLALYDSFADVPFATISNQLPRFGGGSIFTASMGNLAQKLAPEKVQQTLGVDLPTLEAQYESWLGGQLG